MESSDIQLDFRTPESTELWAQVLKARLRTAKVSNAQFTREIGLKGDATVRKWLSGKHVPRDDNLALLAQKTMQLGFWNDVSEALDWLLLVQKSGMAALELLTTKDASEIRKQRRWWPDPQGDLLPVHDYIQRDAEQGVVRSLLLWQDFRVPRYKFIGLGGLPGSGKTTLLRYLVTENQMIRDYYRDGIYWLSKDILRDPDELLRLVGYQIGVDAPDERFSDAVAHTILKRDVVAWLNTPGRTALFVIDDVDNAAPLPEFLQASGDQVQFLYTVRNMVFAMQWIKSFSSRASDLALLDLGWFTESDLRRIAMAMPLHPDVHGDMEEQVNRFLYYADLLWGLPELVLCVREWWSNASLDALDDDRFWRDIMLFISPVGLRNILARVLDGVSRQDEQLLAKLAGWYLYLNGGPLTARQVHRLWRGDEWDDGDWSAANDWDERWRETSDLLIKLGRRTSLLQLRGVGGWNPNFVCEPFPLLWLYFRAIRESKRQPVWGEIEGGDPQYFRSDT